MNLIEEINLIERIDQLIRLKATGSPAELAEKLEICERHLYRIINDCKDLGMPILYCKKRKTYYYTAKIFMKFEITMIDGENTKKLIGGENYLNIFTNKFQTDFLCHVQSSPLYQVNGQQ
jgi:hypothetical protein